MKTNPKLIFGISLLSSLIIFVFFAPFFINSTIFQTNVSAPYLPPFSSGHILGTDITGRDMLLRLCVGGQISLAIAFLAVLLQCTIGVFLGFVSAFFGKQADAIITFLCDVFLSVPTLIVLIVSSALFGDIFKNNNAKIIIIVVTIGVMSWPTVARLVKAQVLAIKKLDYISFAKAQGFTPFRIFISVIFPNIFPQLLVLFTIALGEAIMLESVISFFGLGITPPYPTWGNLLNIASNFMLFKTKVYLWLPSGVCIFLVVFALTLIGEALQEKN